MTPTFIARVLPPITGDDAHDHPPVIGRSPGSKGGGSRASSCWSRGRSTVRRCPAGCRPSGCGTGARGGPAGWESRLCSRRTR